MLVTPGGSPPAIGGAITGSTAGDVLYVGAGGILAQSAITGLVKWSGSGPVAATAGTDYVAPGGVSGGQTIDGGTGAADPLYLYGTSHATPGMVHINTNCLITGTGRFTVANNQGANIDGGMNISANGNTVCDIVFSLNWVTIYGYVASNPTFAICGHAGQTAALTPLQGYSSTAAKRDLGYLDAGFSTSTDATYKGFVRLCAQDFNAVSGGREGIRIGTDGTQALVGLFGATPVAKPTVTGSKGGNAALASLLTALANLGLITDSST